MEKYVEEIKKQQEKKTSTKKKRTNKKRKTTDNIQRPIGNVLSVIRLIIFVAVLVSFAIGVKGFVSYVHIYGSESVEEPTCIDSGYTKKTCKICGKVLRFGEVEAHGHVYDSKTVVEVFNRFSEKDEKYYKCDICGELTKVDVVKKNEEQ